MKKRYLWILGIIVIAIAVIAISRITGREVFEGNSIKTLDYYELEIDAMTGEDSHKLYCKQGQTLRFDWTITKGKADIYVKAFDGEPIYTGNDMKEAGFTIEIARSGEYTITVVAKKVAGKISIKLEN